MSDDKFNKLMDWYQTTKPVVDSYVAPGEKYLVLAPVDYSQYMSLQAELAQSIASVDQETIKDNVLKS